MKQNYKAGNLVVINADDSIVYTIISIYGDGQHTLCRYIDEKTGSFQEVSIPVVALSVYQATDEAEKSGVISRKAIVHKGRAAA